MSSDRPPAPAEGEADCVVSSPHRRKLLGERAAIFAVFSFASAGLAVMAALLLPSVTWSLPVAMGLAAAGMACALLGRNRRVNAVRSSSAIPTAAFVINLLVLVLALLGQLLMAVLRM